MSRLDLELATDHFPAISHRWEDMPARSDSVTDQRTQGPADGLRDGCENLALVLSNFRSGARRELLDKEELTAWLEEYTLGDLWSMGELGGNR